MARLAFTMPGKLGDLLMTLPVVAANADGPVDFWTSRYAAVLARFLLRQPMIGRVFVSAAYQLADFRHGARPREVPVRGRYQAVHHLGFPGFPTKYVPQWLAEINGHRPPGADYRPVFAEVSEAALLGPGWIARGPAAAARRGCLGPLPPCGGGLGWGGRIRRAVPAPPVASPIEEEGSRADPAGAVVATHLVGDFRREHRADVQRLLEHISAAGAAAWHPPLRLWTAEEFDRIAALVARADLFVGAFSVLSCVAALARVPMLVLCEPVRLRAVEWFRPPGWDAARYVAWRRGELLPEIEQHLAGKGTVRERQP